MPCSSASRDSERSHSATLAHQQRNTGVPSATRDQEETRTPDADVEVRHELRSDAVGCQTDVCPDVLALDALDGQLVPRLRSQRGPGRGVFREKKEK